MDKIILHKRFNDENNLIEVFILLGANVVFILSILIILSKELNKSLIKCVGLQLYIVTSKDKSLTVILAVSRITREIRKSYIDDKSLHFDCAKSILFTQLKI